MNVRKAGVVLVAVLAGLGHLTCHQVILTAPPGSTMQLFANPPFIAAHGDVSVISALVMEKNGTPVADGTVVQFFTTLGRIQEQAKTNDGVARVNLVSDSRSGDATITGVSGGGAAAPGLSPTPTPSAAPVAVSSYSAAWSVPIAGASSVVTASATTTVKIGSARPTRVQVVAFPPRITDSRSTHVTANVFDKDGNPVSNVPVIFSIDGNPSTEHLDSGGQPVFTDTNGQAEDVMRTKYPRDATPKTVTVRATTANAITNTVLVTIN